MGLGCVLVGWHAAASVRAEMQSALAVGRSAARNGVEELLAGAASEPGLRHLVATFNGNRHLRVVLSDARGRPITTVSPLPAQRAVPTWFARAIAPDLAPASVAIPIGGAITLFADPANEIVEVWDQAGDAARTIVVFFGLTVLLVHWVVGRALRPLARLATALDRVGAGDYAARLNVIGPPELARIALGFNRMAGQLGEMAAHNDHLQDQVLSLQEEERAELARDLHDEVGPLLFAAGIDAAGLARLIPAGRVAEASARVEAIRDALGQIQAQIRGILGRLRPLAFGVVALPEAIGNLVAFWRSRHPDIVFTLELAEEDEALDERKRATICRVVQESLCNAVRHGQPTQIEISVTRSDGSILVRVADDGVGAAVDTLAPGFGLTGMAERVRAQSGSLAITGRAGGRGLAVLARLPCEAA
jgi:two-component system sensor histidine kinase UhpB